MPPNGISTIDDFRAAARQLREQRAESVRLPSGLSAKLVRPTPLELLFFTGQLPQSIAARIAPADSVQSETAPSAQEVIALSHRLIDLVRFIFASPRVPEEAKPGIDIAVSDIDYALTWARGEIRNSEFGIEKAEGGARPDLAQFPGDRRGPETIAPPGATGGEFPPVAK